MDEAIKAHMANIRSGDRAVQGKAYDCAHGGDRRAGRLGLRGLG